MPKKFLYTLTTSMLCLVTLMFNDKIFAEKSSEDDCASASVKSPSYQAYTYNFNYMRCQKKGGGKGHAISINGIAAKHDVKIGTTIDMGQEGIAWSHLTPPGDTIKKGNNNYVCDDKGCRRQ